MIFPVDNIIKLTLRDKITGLVIEPLSQFADIRIFVYANNECLIQAFDTLGAAGFKLMEVAVDHVICNLDRAAISKVKEIEPLYIEVLTSQSNADFQDGVYVSAGSAKIERLSQLSVGTRI